MNTILKTLAAIALIAVITAACVHIYQSLNPPSVPPIDPPQPGPTPPSSLPPVDTKPVEVEENNPVMPKYTPVNDPVILQNMRVEGKTYRSVVFAQVHGRATKKDWGAVKAAAYFNYIYGVESTGKIVKNDGLTIIEERSFSNVSEEVMVGDIDLSLEIPSGGILTYLLSVCTGADPVTIDTVIDTVNGVARGRITEARMQELSKWIPGFDPKEMKDKLLMFTKDKDHKLLQGKKVRITFKDGRGITSIEPIGCGLTEEEKEIIIRTNFIMDHYIMADKKVAVGDEWTVNADVFSGLIDPRLRGAVGGEVTIMRAGDVPDRDLDGNTRRLKLTNGQITISMPEQNNRVTGTVTNINGTCIIPDKYGVIKEGIITGRVKYTKVSTDHLLFEARMEATPQLNIQYECEVLDSK